MGGGPLLVPVPPPPQASSRPAKKQSARREIIVAPAVFDERITVAPFGQSRFAVPTDADDLLCSGGFTLLGVFFFGRNFQVLVLDVEAEAVENAHVLVGYPYEGEEGDEISTPSRIEHVETSDDQEHGRDVVTETVFA